MLPGAAAIKVLASERPLKPTAMRKMPLVTQFTPKIMPSVYTELVGKADKTMMLKRIEQIPLVK